MGLLPFLFPVGRFVIESPAEQPWGREPEVPGIHGPCIFTRLQPPLSAPVRAAFWPWEEAAAGEPLIPAQEPTWVYIILYIYNCVFVVAMGMSTIVNPGD